MDDSKFKALEGLAIASFVEGIRIGAKIGIESQLEGLNGQDTITLFNKKMQEAITEFAHHKAMVTKVVESKKGSHATD